MHLYDLRTIHIPAEEHNLYQLYDLLSAEEKERAYRFVFPNLSKNYIIVRGILRVLLGKKLSMPPENVPISYSSYGKPFIKDSPFPLHFNISHSGEYAVFAFSTTSEVGIDIEKMDPVLQDNLETLLFSDRILECYNNLTPKDKVTAFYLAWTQKESVLKAEGIGLSGLEKVETELHVHPDCCDLTFQGKVYHIQSQLVEEQYMLSIAY